MDSPSLFDQQHTTRPNQSKSIGLTPIRILIVIGVGAAFLGILVYALIMREDIRTTEVDIPLISPPETAVKRRPDAPGGLEFANRDKLVFNLLDENVQSEAALDATIENLTAPVSSSQVQVIEKPEKITPSKLVEVEKPEQKAPEVKLKQTIKKPEKVQTVTDIINKNTSTNTETPANKGNYGVQLASFVTQKDAERALITFLKTHTSLLGTLTGEVQGKDIGQGRGMRYRARFIGLQDRASATQLCSALKSKNQGCLVVKR